MALYGCSLGRNLPGNTPGMEDKGNLRSTGNPRIIAQFNIPMAIRCRALKVELYSEMPLCLALQARTTVIHYASLQRQSLPAQVHSLIVPSQLAVTSLD
jgi:hypothetical protein